MNKQIQKILEAFQKGKNLSAIEKSTLIKSIKVADQEIVNKNRELEIESALDRIRSKAMAMQKSEELLEAGEILYQELDKLGIASVTCLYGLMDEDEKTVWYYGVNPEDGSILKEPMSTPCTETQPMRSITASWKKKDQFYILELDQQETIKHQTFIAEHSTNFPYTAEELISFSPKRLVLQSFNFKQGYLLIVGAEKLSADQVKMMVRFAMVFELTYRRFLDLKKVEAQAREAEIELALERVRSRAMAMHKSEELLEVVPILFEGLNKLKIALTSGAAAAINIFLPDAEKMNVYVCGNSDLGLVIQNFVHPYSKNKVTKDLFNCRKQQMEVFVGKYSKTEKDNFYKHLFKNSELGDLPKEVKTQILETNLLAMTVVPSEYFMINVVDLEGKVLSQDDVNILKRFSSVFSQAYTRFLDLQKAEAQTREAQIEVALERVRTRAMAMHNPDELTDVLGVLFDQFDFLGINPTFTHLTLFDKKNETFSFRMTTTGKNRVIAEQHIDINAVDAWKDSYMNWQKSKPNIVNCIDYTQEELPFIYGLLSEVINALPEENKLYPKDFPDGLYTTQGHFKHGYIGFNHKRRATKEEKDIVVLFSKEFGRAYQRFLDLQKAEAHNRELEIEAALEKVRSRSLAMHNSEELKGAATELYNQILNLGFEKVDSAGFIFPLPEENIQKCWFFETDSFLFSVFEIPYQGDLVLQERIEASNKGMPYLEQILTGKKLQNHMGIVMPESLRSLALEGAIEAMPSLTIFNMAFFKNGYINLISHDKLSKAEQSILIRFAKVFEQTYTRFLDLQKAEAQAREAQIEAALERVRSKSMAMHNSVDVGDTVVTLFYEVLNLGLDQSIRCGIGILEGFEGMQTWSATLNSNSEVDLKMGMLNMTIHPLLKGVKSWWKKGESGFTYQLIGNEVIKYYKALNNEPDYSFNVDLNTLPKKIFHNSFIFTEGVLFAFTSNPLSEEAKSVLKRFTAVFEQTYTRFLDLQKAEFQVKEAQIEASLERVRSRSMAMHKSEELSEAAGLLYHELVELGLKPFTVGYGFIDEKDNKTTTWAVESDGSIFKDFANYPVKGDAVLNRRYQSWVNKEDFHKEILKGKRNKNHHQYMAQFVNEDWIKGLFENMPELILLYTFNFRHGYIIVLSETDFNKEDEQTLLRFTKVFEQTYTRFLDLQKAESQAREALIEAALEKVRSRTMGMQRSDELTDVATVLFKEVKSLGIEQWTCGFNIWETGDTEFTFYPGSSDGMVLTPSKVPLSEAPVFRRFDESRNRGDELLIYEMKGKEQKEHYKYMLAHPGGLGKTLQSMLDAGHQFPIFSNRPSCQFLSWKSSFYHL